MKNKKNPLIYMVEDDALFRKVIDAYLKNNRLTRVKQFPTGEAMLDALATEHPVVVVADYDLGYGNMDGFELLKRAKAINKYIGFIFLSGQNSINIAVEAIRIGAYDYVVKDDFAKENILHRLKRFIKYKDTLDSLRFYKYMGGALLIFVLLAIVICYLTGARLVWQN